MNNEDKKINLLFELDYAKKAVESCLKQDGVLVDMHDIVYWAERVKILRERIKEML